MIVVIAVFQARAGKEQELEDKLKAVVPRVQQEAGTLVYVLHRSSQGAGKFLFYEKYRDMDALALHGASPYLAELIGAVGPLVEGEPSIELYEELAAKN